MFLPLPCSLLVMDRAGIVLGTQKRGVAVLPLGTKIEVSKIGQKIVNGQILADESRVFDALIRKGRLVVKA